MRILLLSDNLNNWAIHNKAKAIKKFLSEFNFDVDAGFGNNRFLEKEKDYDIVHFLFTAGLTPDYYDYVKSNPYRVALTAVNERSFLFGHISNPKQIDELFKTMPYCNSLSPLIAEKYKIPYIPNGIDTDKFFKHKKPIVGFAGARHIATKNAHLIENVCKKLGLEFRVAAYIYDQATGEIEHEKMQDFYMGLDVYVHPSTTEAFNNTIVEALSCNVPVIMAKSGSWKLFEGWVEFIEPTEEGIEKGLQKYLGRRLIVDKFLWKNLMPEYKKMYEYMRDAKPYRAN